MINQTVIPVVVVHKQTLSTFIIMLLFVYMCVGAWGVAFLCVWERLHCRVCVCMCVCVRVCVWVVFWSFHCRRSSGEWAVSTKISFEWHNIHYSRLLLQPQDGSEHQQKQLPSLLHISVLHRQCQKGTGGQKTQHILAADHTGRMEHPFWARLIVVVLLLSR